MVVPSPSPTNAKRAMRQALRRARADHVAGLTADQRRNAIAPPAAFIAALRPGMVVASYHPIGSEADPARLVDAARAAGATIALPHVIDVASPIRFVAWHGQALDQGPFGLRQPSAGADASLTPDIILTPLVAFDARLNRLGQGAGHYDRAFAAAPAAWRVGIAWCVQQVAAIEADPWDVPLHLIITETDILEPEGRST